MFSKASRRPRSAKPSRPYSAASALHAASGALLCALVACVVLLAFLLVFVCVCVYVVVCCSKSTRSRQICQFRPIRSNFSQNYFVFRIAPKQNTKQEDKEQEERMHVACRLLLCAMLVASMSCLLVAADSSPDQQAGFSFYEYFHG